MIIVKRQFRGYEVIAQAELVGDDWHLRISGGDTPHIGTLSFAWLEEDNTIVNSLIRPKHKDHIVGEVFAKGIAEATKRATAVEAGIHFDQLSKEEIEAVVRLTHEMLSELLEKIPK